MTPVDDNETNPENSSKDSEIPFDIEKEIKKKKQTHRKRSTATSYVSAISFIAWIAFTIIWLFFFAGDYTIFYNIAVVFVALLIIGALNAVIWIPAVEGKKPKASAVSGIIWIAFLIVWILVFAINYGFYENIGIGIASLLFIGFLNMLLWMPKGGEEGAARFSGAAAVLWLIFIVLWLPFANDFSEAIYPITFYQSVAVIIASLLFMLVIVVSPWWGKMQISIDGKVEVGSKPKITVGMLYLWLLSLVLWMWFIADGYTGYQNAAAILISFAIFCGIIVGVWYSWTKSRDEGPESWFSISLAFAWVLILALWFWFFADSFDIYQNTAIFIVSLLGVVAVGGAAQWMKTRDFESMDWTD